MLEKTNNSVQQLAYICLLSLMIIFVLSELQSIIVPVFLALLIALLIRKMRNVFALLPVIKKWNRSFQTLLSVLIFFGVFALFFKLLQVQMNVLISKFQFFDYRWKRLLDLEPSLKIYINDFVVQAKGGVKMVLQTFLNSTGAFFTALLSVLLYLIFFLSEESVFIKKFRLIFSSSGKTQKSRAIFEAIEVSVSNYIGLKSLLAFLNATLCFFIFLIFRIDAPLFWSLLVFLFSFIPAIGFLASSCLPAMYLLLQYAEIGNAGILCLLLLFFQGILNNFLEPKVMGNSLNISPLIGILALVLWGKLWGIAGMFLSVPLTVIMVIIFSKFSATKRIAILLSEKGEIKEE